MRRTSYLLCCVAVLVSFTLNATAVAGAYDNYLKANDIEKVAGLKGVKSVAKGALSGAGGDLNFATSDDKLIVMVQVVGKSQYVGFKKYFFKSSIKGLGEEAMEGASVPGMPSNVVVFVKGAQCVALTAFGDAASGGKKFMLTIAQMSELAKTIAARMK
jgi:hypothetical protein